MAQHLQKHGGITKRKTIIIMTGATATLGLIIAALSATQATSLITNRPPKRAPTAIQDPFVRNTRTAAAELSPEGVEHKTVLRIATDMRSDGYDIVIDGWVKGASLAEVRMWWLNPSVSDERSPFGRGVTRYVDIGYDRVGNDGWRVRMRAGKRQFEFEIELADDGCVQAFAHVDTADGHIQHCRITESRLAAKKLFGLPTGLDKLTVSCVDDSGQTHSGTLRTKKVR